MKMLQTGSFTGVCPYTKAISQFFSEICVAELTATTAGYSNIKQAASECKFSRFFKLSIINTDERKQYPGTKEWLKG